MKSVLLLLLTPWLAMGLPAAEKPTGTKKALISISGITEETEAKLNTAGINNVNDLLVEGATPQGREEMATRSGLAVAQILKFVSSADLFRIEGIDGRTAELLQAAGVNTMTELVHANPSKLHAKMQDLTQAKKTKGKVLTPEQVGQWIQAAKALPQVVTY